MSGMNIRLVTVIGGIFGLILAVVLSQGAIAQTPESTATHTSDCSHPYSPGF